jgi:hypothetical protein
VRSRLVESSSVPSVYWCPWHIKSSSRKCCALIRRHNMYIFVHKLFPHVKLYMFHICSIISFCYWSMSDVNRIMYY